MNSLVLMLLCALPLQVIPDGGEGPSGPQVLIDRIREAMSRIDEALEQAVDAEAPVEGLDRAMASHRQVIRDIDELISQIKYQKSSNSSGGGGGQQSQSESQSQQQQSRESDGQNSPQPGESESQSQEQQGSEQEQGQQEGSEGEQPQQQGGGEEQPSDGMDEQAGQQRDADQPPPPDDTGEFLRADTDGRWGLLPPKLSERLMNLHVDDVPARYRTRLDAYIKAMQRQESGSNP